MKTVHWQPDLEQIKYTRLFNNVALGSLHKLLETACALQLHNGEILLSPFNRNEYLYLVISGQLKVYLGSPDSAPVSVLNVGDCAGEISFIDNERPSAYVLAGELQRARGDYGAAFGAYESRLGAFVARKQTGALSFVKFFTARGRPRLLVRNLGMRAMGIRPLAKRLAARSFRDDIELPDYAI